MNKGFITFKLLIKPIRYLYRYLYRFLHRFSRKDEYIWAGIPYDPIGVDDKVYIN